jgi:sulfur relay (sulfurtransferase) complex TusBCD TusD component (DsrE family)
MNNGSYEVDLGFIITKAPFESTLGSGFLDLAKKTIENGKTVGLFLISDGVWFAKKNQKNNAIKILSNLIEKGAIITVSQDNLEAAGIENNELLDGVIISNKPYMDLVELVMEKWGRVMTI